MKPINSEVGDRSFILRTSMSRHKLVKNLDLDEELDDFDGGAEEGYDDELTPEDKGIS